MKIEIRSNDCAVISGYVNAVERRSQVLHRPGAPPFREMVKPGTFRKALEKGNPVVMKLNHERVLCDTSSGLELREDNVGLYASAAVTDKETVQAARDGRLTGWSFAFYCVSDKWQTDEGGLELRELDDIVLDDVSILTKKPAYIATSVEVRSTDEGSDGRQESMKEVRCMEEQAEVFEDSHALDMVKIELELLSFGGMKE